MIKLLTNFNVVGAMVGTTLAIAFNDIIKTAIKNIINPIIGILFSVKELNEFSINIIDQKINIGYLLVAILNFIIILIMFYVLYKTIFRNTIQTVIEQKTDDNKKLIKNTKKMVKILNKMDREGDYIRPY